MNEELDDDMVNVEEVVTFMYKKKKVGYVSAEFNFSNVPPQLRDLASNVVKNNTEIQVANVKGIKKKKFSNEHFFNKKKENKNWWSALKGMWR